MAALDSASRCGSDEESVADHQDTDNDVGDVNKSDAISKLMRR